MNRISSLWNRLAAVAFAAGLTLSASQARADYVLQTGDVLEIAVASIPDLRQKVPIGIDGSITFPLLGEMKVTGMTVSALQQALGDILPTKIYQLRSTDGREVNARILAQEITVRISDYKPIYLSGDVSKPGEQVYRPGLTARQAIALAGGYDIMRFRMNNPFLDASDLRSEYNGLWLDYAKSQARLARIQAELDNQGDILKIKIEAPLPARVIEQIVAVENEQLRTRISDMQRERGFIDKGINDSKAQAAMLENNLKQESLGVEADRRELDEIRTLQQRGTVPTTRVADARRASLLSSSQYLQTTVQLAQARKNMLELSRQLERSEEARRQEILRDKQEESVKVAQLRARLNAVSEKLLYTGAVKTQLVRGTGNKPRLTIFRKSPAGEERIVAGEDTELRPGDVVDVALEIAPIDAIAN
ncbi:polysaccharide biosynthesis/export family protein [Salinarimonas soli]|uniref:Sugar ABC transporter substrate-binding protein n=1 Tax=Salinarimonas soli TaxID=1638099 RepID=A0A5B2W1K6_9HYPH|nr:polysaccharide biosynthesis/export family protein [Salinarimonas soli]KAA2244386.1 hypothetical protein F0L46_00355 [Salinarimonas soli]